MLIIKAKVGSKTCTLFFPIVADSLCSFCALPAHREQARLCPHQLPWFSTLDDATFGLDALEIMLGKRAV